MPVMHQAVIAIRDIYIYIFYIYIFLTCALHCVQIDQDWHDEQLLDVLKEAAQVVPQSPEEAPSSVRSIIERFCRDTGIGMPSREIDDSDTESAWQV